MTRLPAAEPRRAYTLAGLRCASLALFVLLDLIVPGIGSALPRPEGSVGIIQESEPTPAQPSPKTAGPPCPQSPGGLLDSVSVPVSGGVKLLVTVSPPAPPGGASFAVLTDDMRIAAAGDQQKGFAPIVVVPEGQTLSNPYWVFGVAVGQTVLRAIPLTAGYSGFAIPAAAWELGTGAARFLDANPNEQTTCREDIFSSVFSQDPAVLSVCGQPAKGAVTDGLSDLLLRVRSGLPGTACYEIVSPAVPDPGYVASPYDTYIYPIAVVPTAQVGDVHNSFALYGPPAEFNASQSSRVVNVQLTFTPSVGVSTTTRTQVSIKLVRPPVVLIHGLWGTKKNWGSAFVRESDMLTTVRADYQRTNAAGISLNYPKVQGFVADAVRKSRLKGFATTQVDVIAHSMGGLLSRFYMNHIGFERPDNFHRGDMRKLVTLDTPHMGTSLANLLVNLNDALPLAAHLIAALLGPIDRGAICDLAENSAALYDQAILAPRSFRNHWVTATGAPAGTFTVWAKFVGPLETLMGALFDSATQATHVDPYRFQNANDGIVSLENQRLYRQPATGTTTNFPMLLHTSIPFAGKGVTASGDVAADVLPALDNDAAFAGYIENYLSGGDGHTSTVQGRTTDPEAYARQCYSGGPMNPTPKPAPGPMPAAQLGLSEDVQILAPTPGQVFSPGDTIRVVVQVTGGIQPASAVVVSQIGVDARQTPPFELSLPIPTEASGPIELHAGVVDVNGAFFESAPVGVVVRPDAVPDRLLVENLLLLQVPQDPENVRDIGVVGVYPDGTERDLSSAASGTTYTSSDPAVASVDAEGVVTPVAAGTTIVTSDNMGVQAFTMVEVGDSGTPAVPQEVTASLQIAAGGIRLNRHNGLFVQEMVLSNTRALPQPGPLFLVLSDLPTDVFLIGHEGATQTITPLGSPVKRVPLPDGLLLPPAVGAMSVLSFLDANHVPLTYFVRVFRTAQP